LGKVKYRWSKLDIVEPQVWPPLEPTEDPLEIHQGTRHHLTPLANRQVAHPPIHRVLLGIPEVPEMVAGLAHEPPPEGKATGQQTCYSIVARKHAANRKILVWTPLLRRR
jgi:hypothetical protein